MASEFRPRLEDHPLSCLYPLDEVNIGELAANLVTTGKMTDPIVLLDGKILDGRRRQRAWAMAVEDGQAVEATYTQFNSRDHGREPWNYVVSRNSHRRNAPRGQQLIPILEQELLVHYMHTDRLISGTVRIDHKLVSQTRARMEAEGRIPKTTERIDTRGRYHNAEKPAAPPPDLQEETLGDDHGNHQEEPSVPITQDQETPPDWEAGPQTAPEPQAEAVPPPTHGGEPPQPVSAPTPFLTAPPPDAGDSWEPSPQDSAEAILDKKVASAANVARDTLGQELPVHLRDVFADSFYDDVISSLEYFSRHLTSNPDLYVRLLGQPLANPVAQEMKDFAARMKGHLNYHRPHAVCPNCNGAEAGCTSCYTTGWLSQGQHGERTGTGTPTPT